MGKASPEPLALDAGALIALETPRGRALLREWDAGDRQIVISAGALAQAVRQPERQVLLTQLLRHEHVRVLPLDRIAAVACGRLLAAREASDVVDAHVVLSARQADAGVIVTSDSVDLARLDPEARLVEI